MENQQRKIVHVFFKSTEVNEYFGSLSAIYDYYSKEDIGYTLSTLRAFKIAEDNPFENDYVRIIISRLKQKMR